MQRGYSTDREREEAAKKAREQRLSRRNDQKNVKTEQHDCIKTIKVSTATRVTRTAKRVEKDNEWVIRSHELQSYNRRQRIYAAVATQQLPAEITLMIMKALVEMHLPVAELESKDQFIIFRKRLLGYSRLAHSLDAVFFEALLKTSKIRISVSQCNATDTIKMFCATPHTICNLEIVCDSTAACCARSNPNRRLDSDIVGFFNEIHLLRGERTIKELANSSQVAIRLPFLQPLTLVVKFRVRCCQLHLDTAYWYSANRGWARFSRMSGDEPSPISTVTDLVQALQPIGMPGRKVLKVTTTRTRKDRYVEREVEVDARQSVDHILQEVEEFAV